MATHKPRVAIVGGGITGAIAASALAETFEVHLFDQGRRGPGGRASHRAVQEGAVVADDPPIPAGALEFDHGCQFTRADDPRMRQLVDGWVARGWCSEWKGRFGSAGGEDAPDFFGLPSHAVPVFVGTGGMHTLPRQILAASGAILHRGVRVASMERMEGGACLGMWSLYGVAGEAAYHDSSEATAAATPRQPLTETPFHAVLLTDISSSFGDWHRASAGVPEAFSKEVRDRCRLPLFAVMVAFAAPLQLPYDGLTFGRDAAGQPSPLWFAARSASKGYGVTADAECWTLISTPAFAVEEIAATPMQDASTGAFKPQENAYLNTGPAPALLEAFTQAVAPLRPAPPAPCEPATGLPQAMPQAIYMQGQRWGSAMPAPAGVGNRDALGHARTGPVPGPVTRLMGVAYDSSTPDLVYAKPSPELSGRTGPDFLCDDALGLYYAGDFCSGRAPGFEAAVLSALDAADHMGRALLRSE